MGGRVSLAMPLNIQAPGLAHSQKEVPHHPCLRCAPGLWPLSYCLGAAAGEERRKASGGLTPVLSGCHGLLSSLPVPVGWHCQVFGWPLAGGDRGRTLTSLWFGGTSDSGLFPRVFVSIYSQSSGGCLPVPSDQGWYLHAGGVTG